MASSKKPAFNPDQPFQSADSSGEDSGPKPAFDPSKPFDPAPDSSQSATASTQAQSAVSGFGQGALAGYLPQAVAGVGGLIPNPNSDLDEKLKAQGFQIQQPEDTYINRRDAEVQREEALQKQAPVANVAGQLGGILSSSIVGGSALKAVPGLGALAAGEKATGLGTMARAAGAGAAQGAVQNPGDVPGELAPVQFGERVRNAAIGGALGGAASGVASMVKSGSDLILGLPDKLQDYATFRAFKSAGPFTKAIKEAQNKGNLNQIGQAMIDNGLVGPGASFDSILEKSNELKEKAGGIIGSVYDEAQKKISDPAFQNSLSVKDFSRLKSTEFNAENFADELSSQFKSDLKGKAGSTQALNSVNNILEELRQNGNNANIHSIQEFKQGVDDIIHYDRDLSQAPLAQKSLVKIRSYLSDKIQDRIDALDQALGSNSLGALKEANKQYGTWATVSAIAKNKVASEMANRSASLTDTIAGTGGAVAGAALGYQHGGLPGALKGAALGTGAGIANKLSRTYGSPFLTTGANKASQMVRGAVAPVAGPINQVGGLLTQNPGTTGRVAAGLLNRPGGVSAQTPRKR